MNFPNNKEDKTKYDKGEFELPETFFVRDIENQVFQGIALEALSKIKGISLIEGNFFGNILGRGLLDATKGIHTSQDEKNQSVTVKVEVNIFYGVNIPEKAEEIQTKIAEEITKMTGLHVACVHVVFKNIVSAPQEGSQDTLERHYDNPDDTTEY